MNKYILIQLVLTILFQGCAQDEKRNNTKKVERIQPHVQATFTLSDYLSSNKQLDAAVDKVFKSLDDTAIVAQLIMPAIV